MSVTAEQILDILPIVANQGWRIRVDGGAVRNRKGVCPVCALVNELTGETFWRAAAHSAWCSLTGADWSSDNDGAAMLIAQAADDPASPLRPALMQALGMT